MAGAGMPASLVRTGLSGKGRNVGERAGLAGTSCRVRCRKDNGRSGFTKVGFDADRTAVDGRSPLAGADTEG